MEEEFGKPTQDATPAPSSSSTTINMAADLEATGLFFTLLPHYEAACEQDEQLSRHDKKLRTMIDKITSALADGHGKHGSSPFLSLDSLRHAATWLQETNQHAAEVILHHQPHIHRSNSLLFLLRDYVNLTTMTVQFLNRLQLALSGTRDRQTTLWVSLLNRPSGPASVDEALRDLETFSSTTATGFAGVALSISELVSQHQVMLQKLCGQQRFFRRKQRWKVARIILAAVFAAALVCSLVLVSIFAPPAVAQALALGRAAAQAGWKPLIRLLDRDAGNERTRSLVSEGHMSVMVITEMESIRNLVTKLQQDAASLVNSSQSATEISHENTGAFRAAQHEMVEEMIALMRGVNELSDHVGLACIRIEQAKNMVLQGVVDQIESGNQPVNGILNRAKSLCVSFFCCKSSRHD
ncbi:UPF0496 protein 1-like [Nymphaea colorata]|uniref:UPF0496 protein 1-like n=1 Tax=Nymphaea colorata TaxID=210225 RepID=UPI00129E0C41|nr:UPF0496 protein 1-like [Nymphaea colorata]